MGSLANLLMRTLLNVTIKVNNIVVKYKMPTVMATLTCKSLHVTTADDLRLENAKVEPSSPKGISTSIHPKFAATCMHLWSKRFYLEDHMSITLVLFRT